MLVGLRDSSAIPADSFRKMLVGVKDSSGGSGDFSIAMQQFLVTSCLSIKERRLTIVAVSQHESRLGAMI